MIRAVGMVRLEVQVLMNCNYECKCPVVHVYTSNFLYCLKQNSRSIKIWKTQFFRVRFKTIRIWRKATGVLFESELQPQEGEPA